MKKKDIMENQAVFLLFIMILVGMSVFLALVVKTYIGYVSYEAEAGTITELVIGYAADSVYWQGYYGLGLMVSEYNETQFDNTTPGAIDNKHLVFPCLEPNIVHEIYASNEHPDDLDWSSVTAGTAEWIDEYYNLTSNEWDSASKTFTSLGHVVLGSTNITNISMAYTMQSGLSNSTAFNIGILNVSGIPVFFTQITDVQSGFNNEKINYQLMLPSPNSTLYYFFVDPNDDCPEGFGTGYYGDGYVHGYVLDNVTNTSLANVTIGFGGVINTTDSNGFYNMTVPVGYQYVVGIKPDYYTHVALLNVTLYTHHEYNFSMNSFVGLQAGTTQLRNGTLQGTIRDNRSNLALSGVIVSFAGATNISDGNGLYNLTTYEGSSVLVASKANYDTFIITTNISGDNTTTFNFSMDPTTGTVSGVVMNTTDDPIANVQVSIADQTTTSNSSGQYTIAVRKGDNFIVATKNGFDNFAENITIGAGSDIRYNITLNKTTVLPSGTIFQNGTVTGTVIDNSTNATLENVSVTIEGLTDLTDSSGIYNISLIEGVHSIVAVKDGYESFVGEVNVTENEVTILNISMRIYETRVSNGTITGTVRNTTGSNLENVSISIAGVVILTNSSGGYSISVQEGNHNLIATKSEYQIYTSNVTITEGETLEHDINLSFETPEGLLNGTIIGTVRDNSTNATLSNVTITVGGKTNVTNINGTYNITTTEGAHTIIAVKEGYENYMANVNLSENSITEHNISLAPYIPKISENGTIKGVVMTSTGSLIGGAAISIAGKTSLSNSSGEYNITVNEGTHTIIATRFGYENYVAEVRINASTTTHHNITMNTTQVAATGPGVDAKGTKDDVSDADEDVAARLSAQRMEEQVEYELSIKKILRKLRVGSFLNVPIVISNYRSEIMDIDISLEGDIGTLTRIDKSALSIDPGMDGEFRVTLLGNVEPGIYEGNIVLSGDVDEKIPVSILVYSKEKLPIEGLMLELNLIQSKVYVGGKLRYRIDLQNLLQEEEYHISLTYKVSKDDGEEFIIDSDEAIIQTSFSLLKNFEIPESFETGEYVLSVEANYLEAVARQSALFEVAIPIHRQAFLGIPVWLLLAVVLFLGTSTFTATVYTKRKKAKQRYQAKLDTRNLPGAGERSASIGKIAETNTKAYLDLDKFQIHTLVAGSSGSGKTVVSEILVEEAMEKGVSVIVFDPTAQWTGFLRRNEDKKILELYPKFGLKKKDAKAFNGNIHRVKDGREIIDFKKYMHPGEITVFVTDKLDTKNTELFVANTIKEVFHSNLPESPELKYLLVYDSVHTLLPKFGGSGRVFVQIERATREFRKWGVGLILISQVLSDFPTEVLANINTELQLRTRDEGDLNRVKEEYGENILKSVVKATAGTSMIENSAYNKGQPYFVSFRPPLHSLKRLSDDDLNNYEKYNSIIDDLEYQLEQLKEEKIDVFDLELELKLAKQKMNSGGFNMVSIYLAGLTPRVKKHWDKIGKAPKKREIKLASEKELQEELEDAKKKNEDAKKEKPEETDKEKKPEEEKKEPKQDKKKDLSEKREEEKTGEEKTKETEKEKAKEKLEKEKQAKKKRERLRANAGRDMLIEINELLLTANDSLRSKNHEGAMDAYRRIISLYKDIPQNSKKEVFAACVTLYARLNQQIYSKYWKL